MKQTLLPLVLNRLTPKLLLTSRNTTLIQVLPILHTCHPRLVLKHSGHDPHRMITSGYQISTHCAGREVSFLVSQTAISIHLSTSIDTSPRTSPLLLDTHSTGSVSQTEGLVNHRFGPSNTFLLVEDDPRAGTCGMAFFTQPIHPGRVLRIAYLEGCLSSSTIPSTSWNSVSSKSTTTRAH